MFPDGTDQPCHWQLCFGFQVCATAGHKVDTHSGTRWQRPRWPWPRVCPGKKGDICGSHPLLYGAGRHRATSPAPPQSTRWRGRCTYTWRRQRPVTDRLRIREREKVPLLFLVLRFKSCISFFWGVINCELSVKPICILGYLNYLIKTDVIVSCVTSTHACTLHLTVFIRFWKSWKLEMIVKSEPLWA